MASSYEKYDNDRSIYIIGSSVTNAVRLSAGVQRSEVYQWLDQYNLTAVGGTSATVDTTGGYTQGGGHSPLSRWKGLAADNVL